MPYPGTPDDVSRRKQLFSHQPEQNPYLPNKDPMAAGASRPAPGGGQNPLAQRNMGGPGAGQNPQQAAELARLQAMVLPNNMVQPQPPQAPQPPQGDSLYLDQLRRLLSGRMGSPYGA